MRKAVGDSRVKDGSGANTLKLPECQCEECVPVTVSYKLLFRQYLCMLSCISNESEWCEQHQSLGFDSQGMHELKICTV